MEIDRQYGTLDDLHADGEAPGQKPPGWSRRSWVMRDLQGVHLLSSLGTNDIAANDPIPFED